MILDNTYVINDVLRELKNSLDSNNENMRNSMRIVYMTMSRIASKL